MIKMTEEWVTHWLTDKIFHPNPCLSIYIICICI
jgi:hypothetical protein